ncbi:hypothetical protein GWK47_050056 [Chionoecetes opilio]|uniref:Uncharacterized protein n=1 Tax=Chionoecetes opilio TaxID=41210 RepID=A0A8J4Y306_CHIOP|nr:hypothetical protein GWK47_050056 [Chionoecetes opilio]
MADDGSESVSGESVEVAENEPRPSRSRKRLRNEKEWKRVKAKMARDSGKEYKSVSTGKVVAEKKIGLPCRDGCFAKVTMPVNSVVLKSFWDLASYEKQTAYLQRLVHSVPVKRRRKPLGDEAPTRTQTDHLLPRSEGPDYDQIALHGCDH